MTEVQKAPEQDDKPPIANSWNQLYVIILILHALIIIAFYLFTEIYKWKLLLESVQQINR